MCAYVVCARVCGVIWAAVAGGNDLAPLEAQGLYTESSTRIPPTAFVNSSISVSTGVGDGVGDRTGDGVRAGAGAGVTVGDTIESKFFLHCSIAFTING